MFLNHFIMSSQRDSMVLGNRHKSDNNIQRCINLFESVYAIPNHVLRDNINFLALFWCDDINLKKIYNCYVRTDMSYKKFKDLCKKSWKTDNGKGFLLINMEKQMNNGRYTIGLKEILAVN